VIDAVPPKRDPALTTDEDAPFTWIDWLMMAAALAGLAVIVLTEARP
jgi:hypothetical protein